MHKKRPLVAFWGGGTKSFSDGQNLRVGIHGRYEGQVNLKEECVFFSSLR